MDAYINEDVETNERNHCHSLHPNTTSSIIKNGETAI